MEDAHEAIISKEQFDAAQVLRGKRSEKYGSNSFQSKHLLTGMIFCGHCGGRYYLRNSGKWLYSDKINLNQKKKAGHTMNNKQPQDCELCAYYAYDEDYEEYCCEVNMDEDDYVRYITGGNRSCPFFRLGDEYKIAAKQ